MGSSVDSDLDVDISVLNTNVLGTISLTKAVLPHMIGEGNGQIVVISSASGKCGKFDISLKRGAKRRRGGGVGGSKIYTMLKILHYNINVMKDLIYHSEGREGREGTFHKKRAATHAENFALKH